MRDVEGTDLRALLAEEGPLSPARAVAICAQVAGAVDAAHRKGLVHRDLKPSNVLLDESEHVYRADFGLTRRSAEPGAQPLDGRSLGTPAYLAPEQLQGDVVDGRADVYSLGCLLFECLAGEPPFRRASLLAVAWAHLEDEPPSAKERNRDLPDAVDPVLRKAMAKRPDERYPTCAALIAAAEQALGLRAAPLLRRRSPCSRSSPPRSPPARSQSRSRPAAAARRRLTGVTVGSGGVWVTVEVLPTMLTRD